MLLIIRPYFQLLILLQNSVVIILAADCHTRCLLQANLFLWGKKSAEIIVLIELRLRIAEYTFFCQVKKIMRLCL